MTDVSPAPRWMMRGLITCILAGLCVMVLIGLRYPLKMLPIVLFEFT